MAQSQERRRPYAAPANVLATIRRARTRNLPEKVDADFLRLDEIPDVVFGRVLETLRFLGLIDVASRPTDKFRALASAPDEEYRSVLAGAIREAYDEDFARVDPAQDPQSRLISAFRAYEPRSQTSRMVTLFLGLCREAGISVLEAPRQRSMKSAPRLAPRASSPRPAAGNVSEAPLAPTALGGSGRNVIFGITLSDIAALEEDEFQDLWSALGTVVRVRARAERDRREDLRSRDQGFDLLFGLPGPRSSGATSAKAEVE